MTTPVDIRQSIRQKALELGFTACGFAEAVPLSDLVPVYQDFVASGKAGDMTYLARNTEVRLDPGLLVKDAKTVISLAASYYHPLPEGAQAKPRISRYALGRDYHEVLKRSGWELLDWISAHHGPATGRVFTDSAPLAEREWARRAGIGWIGRNGCLIIPRQGSWFFLAEIVTDLLIPADEALVPDRCGNCRKCIGACPTGALQGDGSMDPRRCISYLTIEHKSAIPDAFTGLWDDWTFGCDSCQEVCPWNAQTEPSPFQEFAPPPGIAEALSSLRFLHDQEEFDRLFEGTPVTRAGRTGILRNFAFLAGKTGNRE